MQRRTLLATPAFAQRPAAGLFQIEKLAEGAWAALALPRAIGNCNAAIFELSDGLLVVDTHARPSAAEAMFTALRKQINKPVKYVVITHIHGDHVQGMPFYRKLAPQAQFITHAATRRAMTVGGNPMPSILANRTKALADAEQKLAAAATPEAKSYWRQVVDESKSFLAEMKLVTLEPPALTLTRDFVIHDRLQEIHILHRGRGHTDGDLVVYSPASRVLAAGDLVVSTTPNLGTHVRDYPKTLNAIAQDCPYDKLVPGHGAVQNGMGALHSLANYIDELTFTVERSNTKRPVSPDQLTALKGGVGPAIGEQIFRWRLQPPEIQSPAQALAAAVQFNADQVYNAIR
jgi:glyoxylase-like metal-dependent hydrolase (beta-lactamase superfamily II)